MTGLMSTEIKLKIRQLSYFLSFHTFSHIERVSFLPVDLCRVTLRNSLLPLPLPRLTVFRFPSEFELPEFYCISRPKNDFSNVTVAMKKETEFSLVCV